MQNIAMAKHRVRAPLRFSKGAYIYIRDGCFAAPTIARVPVCQPWNLW